MAITIRELKEYVKDMPEVDEYGDDFEVWVETKPNLTSPAVGLIKLNQGDLCIDVFD